MRNSNSLTRGLNWLEREKCGDSSARSLCDKRGPMVVRPPLPAANHHWALPVCQTPCQVFCMHVGSHDLQQSYEAGPMTIPKFQMGNQKLRSFKWPARDHEQAWQSQDSHPGLFVRSCVLNHSYIAHTELCHKHRTFWQMLWRWASRQLCLKEI